MTRPTTFHRLSALALLSLLHFAPQEAQAQDSTKSAADEARRKVQEQLDALERSNPTAQEMLKLSGELAAIAAQQEEKQLGLHQRLDALRETKAYKDYLERREALEAKRQTAWDIERNAMAGAARELYAARHAELRKLIAPPLVEAPKLGFDVLTYPRLDGSTSAHPLSVIVAARLLGVPYKWVYPEPTGRPWGAGGRLEEIENFYLARSAAFPYENYEFTLAASRVVAHADRPAQERVAVMVNSLLAISTTTHDALVNLGAGKCDVVLTVRPPTAAERKAAVDNGKEIRLTPIAREALVFFVNHENPVKSLTLEQVRSIYAMKTKRWADVGWRDKEIRALMREPESGSRELFDELVMKGIAQPDDAARRELFSNSMAGPYNRVTTDADAIGYSVYYYDRYMALSPYTRTIAIGGIEPTPDAIAAGKYPLVFPLYAAHRADERPDSAAMILIDWLRSPEGQGVVRESGYVTLE